MTITPSIEKTPVVIERAYRAPADKVWRALTELDQMKRWYFPQLEAFRPEVGFETAFSVTKHGIAYSHRWKVTEVIPGRKISYEWRYAGHPGNTLVTIELFEQLGTTWLRLTHRGIESFREDGHTVLTREGFTQGWTHLLGSALRDYLGPKKREAKSLAWPRSNQDEDMGCANAEP
jgi:uncharacterized protein YndB with AHSA1/START domain